MLGSTLSKAMALGRFVSAVFGLALVLALLFGVASTALGASGEPFLLGKANVATAITKLTGNADGAAMRVASNDPGANDTAIDLDVQDGEAPMKVNSDRKVANLNADYVDGRSFSCPTGTLFHEGVCIERTSHDPAAYDSAGKDCLEGGGRLPTVAELQTFRNLQGQNYSGYELTLEKEWDDSSFLVKIVEPEVGNIAFTPIGALWRYRCVFPPS